MRASLKFTVWTIVVFSCIFEISQAQCNGTTCNSSVLFNTTTTTVNVLNCNLSEPLKHSSSISNLDPGTVHTVFANCFNCCLNATTKPEHVTNLTAESKTTSLSLKWKEPDGNVHSYNVKWTGGGRMNTLQISADVPNLTSGVEYNVPNLTSWVEYNVPNLTSGVEYTVSVVAVAKDGKTEGAEVTISQYTKPQIIRNLSVAHVTTSSMSVNWTEPEGNSSFYIVQWIDESTSKNMTFNVTETSTVITDLTAGVEYTVTVTAVAGDGKTTGSGTSKSWYTKPQIIRNLSVAHVTTSSLTLNWTEPEGNSSFYIVQWIDKSTSKNMTFNVNETFTVITDLTAGVEYTVTVTAVAGDGKTTGSGASKSWYTKPQIIRNLSVAHVTTSSMTVNWTEPEGNSSFYIVQCIDKSTSMNMTFNVTETSTVITDLTAGVEYTVTVTAVAGDGKTTGSGTSKSWYTKPQIIRNLSVAHVTTSSMTVNWTEPEGNSSFYIVQWIDKSTSKNMTFNVTETSTVITNLTAGVEYTVTVTAVAGDGKTTGSGASKSWYTTPQIIRNLNVAHVTTSSMTVNWTEPEGNSSFYIVQWIDKSTSKNMTFNVNETFIVITNLTAGVEYTVTVTAVAGDGKTTGSGTSKSWYTKPQIIRNLSVAHVTTSSLTLNWTEPEGNSSFYIVQWIDKSTSKNMTFNVTETSTVITDLTAGVEYTVTVTAVAGDGKTTGSGTSKSWYTKPQIIRNLSVAHVTTSSMTVNWTEPEGNSSFYIVQWIDKSTSKNMTFNVTETSTVITNLTAGVEYTVTVTAVAGDGKTTGSGASKSWYTKPQIIRNLSVAHVTTSSMSVNWTEPEGNSSFYIVQWIDKSTSMNMTFNVTETSTVITNLTAGVEYTVTVTAVAGDGKTTGSGTSKSWYTKPQIIRNLSVAHVTTSSLTLNWTEPEGNSSFYIVQWIDKSTSKNMTFNVTETSTVITDLTAGVEYTVTVTAVAGDGKTTGSGASKSWYTRPGKIEKLSVSPALNELSFHWDKPDGHVFIFKSVLNHSDGNSKTLYSEAANISFYQLTPGTHYTISLTAVAGDNKTEGESYMLTTVTLPAKPVNITASQREPHSLNIGWTLPEGNADHYVVQLDQKENQTSALSLRFTGLSPGRLHTVSVTAVAGHLNNTSEPSTFATYPLPPGSIRVIQRTNSSLNLTWDVDPEMLDAPNINYSVAYEGGESELMAVMVSDIALTQLNSGTQYVIIVKTVGPEDLRSNGVNVSACTNPNPVLELTAYPESNTSVKVEWSYPQDYETKNYSYILTYNARGNNDSQTGNYTFVTGLEPGTRYTITVTTLLTTECKSTEEKVSTYTKPNPVSNLKVQFVNTSTITLNWASLIDYQPASSFFVQARQGLNVVHNDSTAAQSYTFNGLTPGQLYTFTVTTEVAGVRSDDETITAQLRPAVVNISEVTGSTTHLTVSWSEGEGKVDSYTVFLYNDTHLVQSKEDLSNSTRDTSFYDLTPGVRYCAEVSTKSGTLMNNSSRVCKSTWPAVVNISKVTGSTTNLTVSWSEAEGKVDTYTVLLYNDTHSLVQSKKDLNNSTLNASFTELKPGVKYCAAVVTKSGSLENKSSDLCNATFPNPPRNIRVESRTEQSLTFMWDAPEDMQPDQYNFIVTTHIGPNETKNYSLTLSELESGSPYNISIVTVGVKNYKSQEVRKQAYTKPYSVTDLRQTEITPNSVKLVWNQTAHKSDYTYFIEVSGGVNSTVTNFTHEVEGLISGTNYSFTVTTQAADGTPATPETVSFFTRPYGINALVADTINTTSINVTWEQPIEYQEVYKYLVEISGCSDPKNLTISNESMEIAGLTPGTNCSFCVTVRAANGIEGESNCTSQYTKPEKAQPHVSNQGSNSSLLVSWAKPPGNVEMYTVYLNFTETHLTTVRLNSSGRFHTFEGLPAGRLYTVVVETQSGSFSVPSESITNATYPNPPGAISILNKTTCSIHISWEEAPLMTGAHFYYRLEIPSKQVKNTTATNDTFNHLLSGTPYNISIVTVAAMGFESEAVWHNMVTTRPCSVSALLAEPSEENVTLHWSRPVAYKSTYRFIVTLVNSSGNILQAVKTEYSTHGFDKLDPGSSYYFTVTTVTSDATPAAPEKTSNCTDASAVEFNDCSAPNEPNAKITWFWEKPRGRSSSFTVKLGDTTEEVYEGFKFEKSNLTHYTNYTVEVTTQSCGKPSVTVTKTCQTGITKPPILQNYEFQIDKKFNMFTITMYRSLLDTRYGPITNVGVLLTTNTNTATASTQGLKTTYNQWKKEKTGAYLATVIDITDSDVKVNRHSTPVPLTIHVGDETTWNNYENGVLEPTTQYKFAIVLFTDLKIKSGLINVKESLFSATEFQGHVELPQNPVVIGLAVGLTLAIFLILLLLLIGFIFYWRRLSSKKSSDVQVKCKRAKVNAPVRVEDYEVYYKKQKADSNCGFAAEYEDLKVVGNGLSKTNATNPELKSKNRYNNVLPYDSSRVKLSIINGNPLDDYINANYIPGYNSRKEFIAAQGPLPTTVNDFWRMIWEKNAHAIVMLTRCNEQGRVKCEQYWTSGTKHFGNITVTKTSEIPLDDWTIRDFDVKNVKTAETRLVRQFHFTAWPDHGVPETTELLISFRHLVREHMDQYRHSPTVVHCSAGVGRTGTFIAIDRLIFQIERENVVDVYSIVYDMRMHRVLMVQTEDQYVFLNQCALDIIRSRTGTNVDLIYQNMTAVPIYENIELQKRES